MITSDEARNHIIVAFEEHITLLEHHKLSTDLIKKWEKELVDYISQQEKKDKLLRLYQEKDAFDSFIINGNDYFETSYFNVSEKIEQLKKELGEMK